MTRAIALRMIHAGAVAGTPGELAAWIARTDDLRERLKNDGYGSRFEAEDLFPLFEGFVARAKAATPPRSGARPPRWLWIVGIAVLVAIVVVVVIAGRMA